MSNQFDLEALRRNVQRTILEDGLLDIMLGIYLVLSGVYLNNKSLVFYYFFLPFALVLIEVIRRRYVYPRSGYVKLRIPAGELIKVFVAIIAGIALIIGLTALVAASMGQPLEGNWRSIFTFALIIFTTVFFCAIAYRFHVPRWYLQGILVGMAILVSKVTNTVGLLIGLGVLVAVIGVGVFIRFLQENPVKPNAYPEPIGEDYNAS